MRMHFPAALAATVIVISAMRPIGQAANPASPDDALALATVIAIDSCEVLLSPMSEEIDYGRADREVVASADGQRLRQVFANVMKNALEAIDPRRTDGRVVINLFAEEERAVVEIIDNGGGITLEDREKIFLPFFTTKPSGTGLGMAIVKKIMDLHNGEIEIDSLPGGGTAVRLVIPRATQAAPAPAG